MLINILSDLSMIETIKKCAILAVGEVRFNHIELENVSSISNDILKADMWIIEAFSDDEHPYGFQAAYNLVGTIKCILLFTHMVNDFPHDGPFWCNLITGDLTKKIREVANNDILPFREQFDELIKIWPQLGHKNYDHHHR